MARETTRQYWEEQLSEYWDSGFTIPEYSELKELPYESVRRWIRLLKQEQEGKPGEDETLEMVEVAGSDACSGDNRSGVSLRANGIEIDVEKGFDSATLREVLNLIGRQPCLVSAAQ